MKKLFLITSVLLLPILTPLAARADVQSCTNQIIQKDLSRGPHDFGAGKIIQTETYQGINYHLIFLDGGWKEVELVIKEGKSVCEKLVYNPTGSAVSYSQFMPQPVAKKLDAAARAYSKAMWEKHKTQNP